jgi:hypothetical protein
VVSPPPAPHLWHPLTVSPELRAQPQVHDRRAGEGQPRRRNPGTRAQQCFPFPGIIPVFEFFLVKFGWYWYWYLKVVFETF